MHPNYEIALGTDMQIWSTICIIFLIVCVLNFIMNEETSPQVVFVVGLTLIAISVYTLWCVEEMKSWVIVLREQKLVSDAFAVEFQKRSNVFLYVLPFVTAAIGTNFISDVYTKRLHYKENTSLIDVIKFVPELVKISAGLFIFVPVCLFIVMPLSMTFGAFKKNRFRIELMLNNYHRKGYLFLLKMDILFRYFKEGEKRHDE